MATRIVFLNSQETAVTGTQDEVWRVVGRGHPNRARLEGVDSVVLYVKGAHITSAPGLRPVP
jgi:hypothetical protein